MKRTATPGHSYELHKTNTAETDTEGKRYRYCIYDRFDVNGQKGISFWYFVTKEEALQKYPDAGAIL
jgi:hypothetical protein